MNLSLRNSLKTLAMSAAIVALLPACASLMKIGTDPATAARIGNLTYSVVKTGTAATLLAKPEYRPQFEAAKLALDGMLAADRADLAELSRILATLDVKELRGPEGALAIEGGLFLYEVASGYFWQPESRAGITIIVTRARDGLADALRVPPSASRDVRRAYPTRSSDITRKF